MIFILVVAIAMGALTWLLGWWGVVLAAAIVGYSFRGLGGGGWRVALAAALAWLALLLADGLAGPLETVARTLGGVMRVPELVLLVVTLLFPALLAWSAATLVAELARLTAGRA